MIMHLFPFDQAGQFYRGNLHCHSTRSDGDVSPEEVCRLYRQAGYDFISLTDHFLERYGYPLTDTRESRTDSFTTIIGAELHAGTIRNGTIWHMVGVGLPLDFSPPAEDENGPGLARRAIEAGAFVGIAHPSWYGLTEEDALSLGEAHAVEVYNGIADADRDRGDSWPLMDVLLDRGERFFAYAADDTHFRDQHDDFCKGWVHVKSDSLDPDQILEGLKRGAYYSSTGPEIHDIRLDKNRKLIVDCSPASQVFLIGAKSKSKLEVGIGLTQATFDLSDWDNPFFRITVRDRFGHRAWTNPFWLDSLDLG